MSELEFTEERLERYSRHILLKDVGIEGQIKIFDAKVLIIGAGGLGSPAALYLAAAGVGTIGIADADTVDLSNLQRQVIHFTADVGKPKVESAAEKMRAINPDVQVHTYHEWVRAANIRQMIRGYDFVIDGTDNFVAKFLINDACVLERKPFSHGGILRFNGQTMTVLPGESACYRCAFRTLPPRGVVPSCSEAGILGAVAGMLGTIQAAETLKFVTGVGELLTNALLIFDAKDMSFSKVRMQPNPKCAVCGEHPTIHELVDEEQPVCELKAARSDAG
jgi:molybdopterin/thiamine biosynthesis adenylyltransferase